jgi:hypothetical protein
MKIKSTATDPKKAEPTPKYPWIGIAKTNNDIVLFTAYKKGVLLKAEHYSDWRHVGYTSDTLIEDCFEPYIGSITIMTEQ